MTKTIITVEATIAAPIEKIWEHWTEPAHIVNWAFPSDDWHAPKATNDLKAGGKFFTRLEAKDGSFGFDFEGVYSSVEPYKSIAYTIADGRDVTIDFVKEPGGYRIIESFEAEDIHPVEFQKGGWQAFLDNFKKNVETSL